jgi:hypothetical protein
MYSYSLRIKWDYKRNMSVCSGVIPCLIYAQKIKLLCTDNCIVMVLGRACYLCLGWKRGTRILIPCVVDWDSTTTSGRLLVALSCSEVYANIHIQYWHAQNVITWNQTRRGVSGGCGGGREREKARRLVPIEFVVSRISCSRSYR